jgi:hypothetical protein
MGGQPPPSNQAATVSSTWLSAVKLFRRAFLRFQNCPIVFVASSSQSGSASSAINSTALKNLTAFGFGLPSGRNFPALTRIPTSSVEQFNSFATCAASNRAGKSFAAQVANAACVISSLIRQSDLGIVHLQAIPSGRPHRRPPAARGARRQGLPLPGPINVSIAPMVRRFIGGIHWRIVRAF